MRYSILRTPIGELQLTADDDGALTGVNLPGCHADPRLWIRDDDALRAARTQLTEYFGGERTAFELPLRPGGGAFQLRVWEALRAIPYGETTSYGALARALGAPGAARAVGAANGANPIAIVVPCHRVVGASGALTGYAGGLACKRALLDLEIGRAALV